MSNKSGNTFRRILTGGMVIFVIVYIIMLVVSNNNGSLRTETATYARVSDTVELEAWVIRDEQLVSQSTGGILAYQIDDGDHVSSGGIIAKVYLNDTDATSNTRATQLQSEIDNIESLSTAENLLSSNIEDIGSRISLALSSAAKSKWEGDYNTLRTDKSTIQYHLCEKQIVLGTESQDVITSRINSLENDKNRLLTGSKDAVGQVVSPSAGYFSSNTDGYESMYNVDNINSITVSDIDTFSDYRASNGNFCGRVCSSFKWYVVARVDESQKIKIEDSGSIKLKFRTSGSYEVPAEVIALNPDRETGDYACVFECSYMNEDLINLRNEAVTVIVDEYSGVLVSEKAVHFANITEEVVNDDGTVSEITHDNVRGVYVKSGERLKFVQIFTESTINGYCVCRTTLTEEDKEELVTSSTIKLYDEVVVGGTNLYDGKIID